jgi:simple sugar transport system permease protein
MIANQEKPTWQKLWSRFKPEKGVIFRLLTPIVAVIVALLGGAIVIAFSGVNPIFAYGELIRGAFGNGYSISEIFVRSLPLAFTGLAFALAFRGGLLNIGAEGQLYLGALGATLVALFFPNLPSYLLIPLTMIGAMVFGAIWGAIPAILKAKWNVNEFVNTVMMNYIGMYFVNYIVSNPLREKTVTSYPQTEIFVQSAWMPKIFGGGTRLTYGFFILIAVAIVVYILLWHTSLGYQIRVIGFNRIAAKYSGMKSTKLMLLTMMISGALAGIGGGLEVTGIQHRLMSNFSPGYGYTGIIVALLGRDHPFGVIVASLFFGMLRTGARSMESFAHVSYYVTTIIEALTLLAILSSDYVIPILMKSRKKIEA